MTYSSIAFLIALASSGASTPAYKPSGSNQHEKKDRVAGGPDPLPLYRRDQQATARDRRPLNPFSTNC
jgi:hypothetical protein